MKFSVPVTRLCAAILSYSIASAQSISQINGNKFLSPYRNQSVYNVTGLITAIGTSGLWIRSTVPDTDVRTSESIYVFGNVTANVTTGDIITLDGRVSEYRSSSAYIYLTELIRPTNIKVVSRGNKVKPVVLGQKGVNPPTAQYTSLDNGDTFGLPNNGTQISNTNPVLDPTRYGLDFWESLSGELVTVKKPTAVAKPNSFGDTWVIGNWNVSGQNDRGGLTITPGDANPEAILIGDPLDGSNNPNGTKLGDSLEDITGVITYAFGYYRILPYTNIKIKKSEKPALPKASKWKSNGACDKIVIGDYNVENLAPNTTHLPAVAAHIVHYLNSPDIMIIQEIQDNDGPTDDAVVSANVTLDTLVRAIDDIGPVAYNYIDIDPVNDKEGGQPGGNIRVAYLYNPATVRLHNVNPGSSTDANVVLPGPSLKYNPGRIDPANSAWISSRVPLVAQWQTLKDNSTFFTVNVHFTSKGGSSSIEGDARPPVNGGVTQRIVQANVTASFVSQILAMDPNAAVVTAGDFNEFTFVQPLETFVKVSGMIDLDEAAGITAVERYTYLFDMNSQEIDHMFVSPKIASRKPSFEHVHVNTWVSAADQVSDHDPSVARLNVCT